MCEKYYKNVKNGKIMSCCMYVDSCSKCRIAFRNIHFLGIFAHWEWEKKQNIMIDFSFDIVYNRKTNFRFLGIGHIL